jgi:DNA-directed RNA polymerase specialized sigma24 family protein
MARDPYEPPGPTSLVPAPPLAPGMTSALDGERDERLEWLVKEIGRITRGMVPDMDAADDIAQEISAFVAHRRANGDPEFLSEPEAVAPFTRMAVAKRKVDIHRADMRRLERQGTYVVEVEQARLGLMTPESILDMKFLQSVVVRVLAQAPLRDQHVFLRIRQDGCTYTAVAAEFGLTVRIVKRTMLNLNAQFRAAVEHAIDGGTTHGE